MPFAGLSILSLCMVRKVCGVKAQIPQNTRDIVTVNFLMCPDQRKNRMSSLQFDNKAGMSVGPFVFAFIKATAFFLQPGFECICPHIFSFLLCVHK